MIDVEAKDGGAIDAAGQVIDRGAADDEQVFVCEALDELRFIQQHEILVDHVLDFLTQTQAHEPATIGCRGGVHPEISSSNMPSARFSLVPGDDDQRLEMSRELFKVTMVAGHNRL